MKPLIMAFSLLTLLLPAYCFAFDLSGSYTTTEGNMTLQQSGDRVTGRYTQDNGEITGLVSDSSLDGFWIEDHSDHRCPKPKHGRYYWGRIALEFTENGFSGSWGYCNDAPSRPWNGTRVNGGTTSPPDSGAFDGESIEGLWGSSEGDLTFKQHGSRVSGTYNPQDNGEITGVMRGPNLDAYWIENSSGTRCGSPKNGRYHWGRLQLRFAGDRFAGKWGYCEEKPSRQWTGQRK